MSAWGTSVAERLTPSVSRFDASQIAAARRLRVAMPGIIQSFDASKQTVVVRLALREHLRIAGQLETVEIPDLPDVPICVPRAGGYSVTVPIQAGDECLVVFADMCIDSWWQSGGQQNQIEQRRHDLSDGFAILAPWSQPRVLQNYSTNSLQIRSDDGQTIIDVTNQHVTVTTPQTVTINATDVTVNASNSATVQTATATVNASDTATIQASEISVQASGQLSLQGNTVNIAGTAINVNGGGKTIVEGRNFLLHDHSAVQSGPSVSGPVV